MESKKFIPDKPEKPTVEDYRGVTITCEKPYLHDDYVALLTFDDNPLKKIFGKTKEGVLLKAKLFIDNIALELPAKDKFMDYLESYKVKINNVPLKIEPVELGATRKEMKKQAKGLSRKRYEKPLN